MAKTGPRLPKVDQRSLVSAREAKRRNPSGEDERPPLRLHFASGLVALLKPWVHRQQRTNHFTGITEELLVLRGIGDPYSTSWVIDKSNYDSDVLPYPGDGSMYVDNAIAARDWALEHEGEEMPERGPAVEITPEKNPAALTIKGKRMYESVKKGYEAKGDPRAKEIASRTVLARAKTTPGLKNPSATMIHIPLDQTAAAITDSATQVLVAHGYRVVTKTGEQLSPTEGRALMREIGNNAAQVLAGMDENPENQ